MKKTVAVIFGGEGAERHISELSAACLIKDLADSFNTLPVGIDEDGCWYIFSGSPEMIKSSEWNSAHDLLTPTYPVRISGKSGFYREGELLPVDVAFPVLHGDFGEDGIVQGALKCAHISYIGSDVIPSAITADKVYTKIVAEHLGITTAPWIVPSANARAARREAETKLGYPMFIKPRRLGSSVGASSASCPAEFIRAYSEAYEASDGLLMIEGRVDIKCELEFALYGGKERFISGAGSINTSGEEYSYEKKYASSDSYTEISPKIDSRIIRRARTWSRKLSDFLGLGNISRIDFFLTNNGELIFNEINSIPGMTQTSLYPALVRAVLGKSSFPGDLINSGKWQ